MPARPQERDLVHLPPEPSARSAASLRSVFPVEASATAPRLAASGLARSGAHTCDEAANAWRPRVEPSYTSSSAPNHGDDVQRCAAPDPSNGPPRGGREIPRSVSTPLPLTTAASTEHQRRRRRARLPVLLQSAATARRPVPRSLRSVSSVTRTQDVPRHEDRRLERRACSRLAQCARRRRLPSGCWLPLPRQDQGPQRLRDASWSPIAGLPRRRGNRARYLCSALVRAVWPAAAAVLGIGAKAIVLLSGIEERDRRDA